MRALLSVAAAVPLLACVGCSSTRPSNIADGPPIAAVHASKCGACHVPVEPGTRSREQLEGAFTRHQRRLHLTQEQWQQMIEYLAAD
jgi:hypothetical protein